MKKILLKTDQSHPAIVAYKETMQRAYKGQHVYFRNGSWIVKRGDPKFVPQVFSTEQEALQYAEGQARQLSASMFVHGEDGFVKERRDF